MKYKKEVVYILLSHLKINLKLEEGKPAEIKVVKTKRIVGRKEDKC